MPREDAVMTDLKFDPTARVGIGDYFTPNASLHIQGAPPDIDQMPAGPEMDALVAEVVMGWSVIRLESGSIVTVEVDENGHAYAWTYNPGDEYYVGFKPSVRVQDSRQVLDHLVKLCSILRLDLDMVGPGNHSWCCRFSSEKPHGVMRWCVESYGETETLALCRAAYKAMEYIKGGDK